MIHNSIRGRFAPSPSGRLHLGNMLSSLLAWLDIRKLGGEMIFRLEDLDPDRSHGEFSKLMADDLEWLGLDWDIGWRPNCNEEYAQSNRTVKYEQLFERFKEKNLVYPCYCSRAQRLAASAPHPGELTEGGCACKTMGHAEQIAMLEAGKRPSYKIRVTNSEIDFVDAHCGPQCFHLKAGYDDFIIRRSDGVFAYQFAVSYDDAVMGVSRVVRAKDLLDSTPKQIWLIKQMGYTPPIYCHAPLLTMPDGRKMSKRNGDLCMAELRKTHTPDELCGKLAYIAGLIDSPQAISASELIPLFSWDKIPPNTVILDEELFK